jgi:hypothetical protein
MFQHTWLVTLALQIHHGLPYLVLLLPTSKHTATIFEQPATNVMRQLAAVTPP